MSSCPSLLFLDSLFPTHNRANEARCFRVQNGALQDEMPTATQTSKWCTTQGNTTDCYGKEFWEPLRRKLRSRGKTELAVYWLYWMEVLHPTQSGSSKRKHCPCLCFRTGIFMLCKIHILTKVNLSCTVLCVPKQDHARTNRLWSQSQQLCVLQWLVYPKDGSTRQHKPWLKVHGYCPSTLQLHTPAQLLYSLQKNCVHLLGRALACEKDCHTAPFM